MKYIWVNPVVVEMYKAEEILTQIPKYKGVSQDQVDVIEMLYCKGGCHNGNGV